MGFKSLEVGMMFSKARVSRLNEKLNLKEWVIKILTLWIALALVHCTASQN